MFFFENQNSDWPLVVLISVKVENFSIEWIVQYLE